ncbi:hypothetical protein [Delftia deserti]
MRAMWAAQHTLPLGDDADPEWGEYSEEKDEYFCPAGWYEMNQHEEQHWGVDGNVVAWCELPRLAQIVEPAGAAPAAVAPQGEYPYLPQSVGDVTDFGDGKVDIDWGHPAPVCGASLYSAEQMRAYVDADRAARAAQPTAVAGPAIKVPEDWMEHLGFELDAPADGVWMVIDDTGARREANLTERILWKELIAIRAAIQDAALAPAAPALEAPVVDLGDLVAVPRDLIGSACAAIVQRRAAPKTLAELRRYTTGDLSRHARAAAPQALATDLTDAYTGAREDLTIWKRRALEAERDLRAEREANARLVAEINAASGPTHMGEAAPQAPAAPVDDLAQLVKQLVRALRKAAPGNDLADKALDYLKRQGLQGSPLRTAHEAPPTHVGLLAAAAHIQAKAQAHLDERGSYDPDTGAVEMSESNQEHFNTLDELAEEIRLMADKAAPAPCGKPPQAPAAPAVDALAPVQALLDVHAELLDANPYAYFELAYTRQTGWMAWITDKPFHGPVINPDRKVLARGQGDTASEACAAAAQAKEGGA